MVSKADARGVKGPEPSGNRTQAYRRKSKSIGPDQQIKSYSSTTE